jgi:hypothetical protein
MTHDAVQRRLEALEAWGARNGLLATRRREFCSWTAEFMRGTIEISPSPMTKPDPDVHCRLWYSNLDSAHRIDITDMEDDAVRSLLRSE